MKVIKKDGRTVEYNSSKIKTSIANCASDINYILNDSDLDNIVNFADRTLKAIRNKDLLTSSYEIRGVVIDALIKEDFIPVVSAYIRKKI